MKSDPQRFPAVLLAEATRNSLTSIKKSKGQRKMLINLAILEMMIYVHKRTPRTQQGTLKTKDLVHKIKKQLV